MPGGMSELRSERMPTVVITRSKVFFLHVVTSVFFNQQLDSLMQFGSGLVRPTANPGQVLQEFVKLCQSAKLFEICRLDRTPFLCKVFSVRQSVHGLLGWRRNTMETPWKGTQNGFEICQTTQQSLFVKCGRIASIIFQQLRWGAMEKKWQPRCPVKTLRAEVQPRLL